jgi:hypothetical protein
LITLRAGGEQGELLCEGAGWANHCDVSCVYF